MPSPLEDWLDQLNSDWTQYDQSHKDALEELKSQEEQDQAQLQIDQLLNPPELTREQMLQGGSAAQVYRDYQTNRTVQALRQKADLSAQYDDLRGSLHDDRAAQMQDYLEKVTKAKSLMNTGLYALEDKIPVDWSRRSDMVEDPNNPGSYIQMINRDAHPETEVRSGEIADFLGIPQDIIERQRQAEAEDRDKTRFANQQKALELGTKTVQYPTLGEVWSQAPEGSIERQAALYGQLMQ